MRLFFTNTNIKIKIFDIVNINVNLNVNLPHKGLADLTIAKNKFHGIYGIYGNYGIYKMLNYWINETFIVAKI